MSELNGIVSWKREKRLNREKERLKESSVLPVTINFYSYVDVCACARARERRIKGNEVCQLSVKFFENIRNVS